MKYASLPRRCFWALLYAKATVVHKFFVFRACMRLRVPLWQALVHDLSKFTLAEMPAYGRQFFGDKGDPAAFARAWLHHQNHNPHHWEYWMPRTGHLRQDAEMRMPPPLEMPPWYAREMVADWLGASRAYTGSWNMTLWLDANWPRIQGSLHPRTATYVKTILSQIGYRFSARRRVSEAKQGETP